MISINKGKVAWPLNIMLSLFLLMQFAYPLNSEADSIKAGTACLKENSVRVVNNYKYTCIKSGKKLIWSKGVLVKRTPTPSPKPPTTPTPTPINTPQPSTSAATASQDFEKLASAFSNLEIFKAFEEIQSTAAINKNNSSMSNINWILDSTISSGAIDAIKDKFRLTNNLYSATNPTIDVPLRVYIYDTKNFAKMADLVENDLTAEALTGGWLDAKRARAKEEPTGFYGGASPGYGKDGKAVLFYNITDHQTYSYVGLHSYTHELVHVYQRQIMGNMQRMTCWMREGQAVYLGFNLATTDRNAFINSWKAFYDYMNYEPTTSDFYTKSESDWINWMRDQELKEVTTCDPLSNYVYGAIFWSYLYGHYGFQKTSNFFSNTAKYPVQESTPRNLPGDSWKKSYLESFGVTPESDYPAIAKYFVNEAKWVKSWKS